jgi:hypothetical protein
MTNQRNGELGETLGATRSRHSIVATRFPTMPLHTPKRLLMTKRGRAAGISETERACVLSAATLRDRGISSTDFARAANYC